MMQERKGPDFMPYSEWIVGEEKRRRRRSWFIGAATALSVLALGSAIMVPIFSRRKLMENLAARFGSAEQVLITEEHVGPNNVRFDKRVLEENGDNRRLEYEGGNIIFIGTKDGGSKIDRRRGTHVTYVSSAFTTSPYRLVKDLVTAAVRDVRTSVQKTEMSDGRLQIRDDNRVYSIKPGQGEELATVDVQIETDLGLTTVITWKIDKVRPDLSKFFPDNFSRRRGRRAVSTIVGVEPEHRFETSHGKASLLRLDVNEKGDVYIADQSTFKLDYDIKVTDGATYAWSPTGVGRTIIETGENIRENLAYRKRGVNLTFPLTVEISTWPADEPNAKRYTFKHTFERPTCTVVPEYEHGGGTVSDQPLINQRLRAYMTEASLAETGFGLVRYANAEVPVKDAMNALTYYRFALSYTPLASPQTFGASTARMYYSIYRCYVAARQDQAGYAALRIAKAKNNSRDPWLDQKIDEAMIREGLVEVE